MRVQVFAALKDHFDKEFELDTLVSNTEELKEVLIHKNPSTANILSSCRFVVDDSFIDEAFKLKPDDTIAVIPPSSGG
jgi:molybdopterin converting factor small subunit